MTSPATDNNTALWLAHIADMLGAEASGMLTLHPDGRQDLITNGHSESAIAEYRDHYSRLDPLSSLLAERPDGRAIVLDTIRLMLLSASCATTTSDLPAGVANNLGLSPMLFT